MRPVVFMLHVAACVTPLPPSLPSSFTLLPCQGFIKRFLLQLLLPAVCANGYIDCATDLEVKKLQSRLTFVAAAMILFKVCLMYTRCAVPVQQSNGVVRYT